MYFVLLVPSFFFLGGFYGICSNTYNNICSIFLIYYFYYVLFARRGKNRCPAEATYLIRLYKLDINKFSYRRYLLDVSFVTSVDISITAIVIFLFDKLIWQILFGLITIIPIIAISFTLLGKYYVKKQNKDNSKELEKEKRRNDRQDKLLKVFKKKGKK